MRPQPVKHLKLKRLCTVEKVWLPLSAVATLVAFFWGVL